MKTENALIPSSEELNVYQVMAKTATQSQLFGKIGGEAGLLSIMLMARELGLPPMQAIMGGMNVIQGKVEISPRMMNTMIRKAGHKLEILESTEQLCKIKGTRHDTKEEYIATFSLEDARKAGLVRSGGGWEKYSSDMLFARCISRLARRLFADVISTAYVEGEIDRPEREETPQFSNINVEGIEVIPETQKIEEKPKEMSPEEFVAHLKRLGYLDFEGLGLDAYLYELSVKKGGKPIPIQKVMEQALKMPDRFVKSYNEWYGSQAEAEEALAKS